MIEPPLGFDIIVLSILEGFPNPWPMLSDAIDVTYARLTQAHGSPPDMTTICKKFDWWYHDEIGIILTWDAPDFGDDMVPEEFVVAVINGRVAA
jgi:hypothetical protein